MSKPPEGKKDRMVMVGDPELKAMNALAKAYGEVGRLEPEVRGRVVVWARSKFHTPAVATEEDQ